MKKKYQIAGHCFEVSGEKLCEAVTRIQGFNPFEVSEGKVEFLFREGAGKDIPQGLGLLLVVQLR